MTCLHFIALYNALCIVFIFSLFNLSDMQLYLIRHATAVNVGENKIITDENRTLSPHGEIEAGKIGAFLKANFSIDLLLHSPILRAVQTAEILNTHLQTKKKSAEKLSTDYGLRSYMDVLHDHHRVEHLAMVAHQPTIEKMIVQLIGTPKPLMILPCTAAVMTLELTGEMWKGTLEKLVSPAELKE
jgi:phosphohistidine phosphatase SixA